MLPFRRRAGIEPEDNPSMVAIAALILAGAGILAIIWFIALTPPS